MTNLRKLMVIAVTSVIVVSLGACSEQVVAPETGFSGPWATELQQAYDWASSPAAKAVLADGVITHEEMEEIKAEQISCLENLGCTVFELNPDGPTSILGPQEEGESLDVIAKRTQEFDQQYAIQTGWSSIGWLYAAIKKNPDNQEPIVLMVECLVRVGLESEGYTAEQYMLDLENDHFLPYLDNQETPEGQKFWACNLDPLHAQ